MMARVRVMVRVMVRVRVRVRVCRSLAEGHLTTLFECLRCLD